VKKSVAFDPLFNKWKNQNCNDYNDNSNHSQKKLQGHECVKYNSDTYNQQQDPVILLHISSRGEISKQEI
jgi:hypothetical protein